MNATNKLLDKWIEWRSSKSGGPLTGAAIAVELGVKPTSISNYRVGTSQAAPHVIEKMARDIGESPAAWLALVESERARDAADRKAWLKVARQLGAAAALAVVALFPAGNVRAAALMTQAEQLSEVCIMRSVRRRARALAQRMQLALSRLTDRAYGPSPVLA